MAYVPIGNISTAGNSVFCALFGIQCLIHTFLGLYYRRWKFALLMFLGTASSTIGYAGRAWFSRDENTDAYIMQAVCVAVGPGLVTGALKGLVFHFASYMRMKKLDCESNWFMDSGLQRFQYYEKLNKVLTIGSTVLLGVGIGIFSNDTDGGSKMQKAARVTLAAFAIQLGLVVITLTIWGLFIYNALLQSFMPGKVRTYVFGIFVVFICVLIRLCYRVAEWAKIINEGLNIKLILNENYLLCLDGMMILLAGTILILLHPGLVFGMDGLKEIDHEFEEYNKQKEGGTNSDKKGPLNYVPVVRLFA